MNTLLPKALFLSVLTLYGGCSESDDGSEKPVQQQLKTQWNGTVAQRESTFFKSREGGVELLLYRATEEPFTGKTTTHGPEGEERVFRYRQGKKHGLCIIKDKSGGRTETNYRDGIEHGMHIMFGRNGNERFRWRYENGEKVND